MNFNVNGGVWNSYMCMHELWRASNKATVRLVPYPDSHSEEGLARVWLHETTVWSWRGLLDAEWIPYQQALNRGPSTSDRPPPLFQCESTNARCILPGSKLKQQTTDGVKVRTLGAFYRGPSSSNKPLTVWKYERSMHFTSIQAQATSHWRCESTNTQCVLPL